MSSLAPLESPKMIITDTHSQSIPLVTVPSTKLSSRSFKAARRKRKSYKGEEAEKLKGITLKVQWQRKKKKIIGSADKLGCFRRKRRGISIALASSSAAASSTSSCKNFDIF